MRWFCFVGALFYLTSCVNGGMSISSESLSSAKSDDNSSSKGSTNGSSDSGSGGSANSPSSLYSSPRGIFTASGVTQTSNNPLSDSKVKGGLVRVAWTQICSNTSCSSSTSSDWTWTTLDNSVSSVRTYGKNWSLAVLGGPIKTVVTVKTTATGAIVSGPTTTWGATPNFSDITTFSSTVNLVNPGTGQTTTTVYTYPKFWDVNLQTHLNELAKTLANRYGSDSSLKLVYIPQMTQNGVEGAFYATATDSTLTGAGLTIDKWLGAIETTAKNFSAAFSTKAIAIETHYLLGSSCEGLRLMYDIINNQYYDLTSSQYASLNRTDTKDQVGVAAWWYSNAQNPDDSSDAYGEYQADLLFGVSSWTFNSVNYGPYVDNHVASGYTGTGGIDHLDAMSSPSTDTYGQYCTNKSYLQGGFKQFAKLGGSIFTQLIQQSDYTKSGTTGADCTSNKSCTNFVFKFGNLFQQAIDLGVKYIEVWQQDLGPQNSGGPSYTGRTVDWENFTGTTNIPVANQQTGSSSGVNIYKSFNVQVGSQ